MLVKAATKPPIGAHGSVAPSETTIQATCVSVTVTPGNDAPVADNDTLTTQMGTPGSVDVLAGDVDVLTSEAGSGAIRPRLRRLQRGDGRLHVHAVSVTVEERNSSPSCANVKPSKKKLWRSTSSS